MIKILCVIALSAILMFSKASIFPAFANINRSLEMGLASGSDVWVPVGYMGGPRTHTRDEGYVIVFYNSQQKRFKVVWDVAPLPMVGEWPHDTMVGVGFWIYNGDDIDNPIVHYRTPGGSSEPTDSYLSNVISSIDWRDLHWSFTVFYAYQHQEDQSFWGQAKNLLTKVARAIGWAVIFGVICGLTVSETAGLGCAIAAAIASTIIDFAIDYADDCGKNRVKKHFFTGPNNNPKLPLDYMPYMSCSLNGPDLGHDNALDDTTGSPLDTGRYSISSKAFRSSGNMTVTFITPYAYNPASGDVPGSIILDENIVYSGPSPSSYLIELSGHRLIYGIEFSPNLNDIAEILSTYSHTADGIPFIDVSVALTVDYEFWDQSPELVGRLKPWVDGLEPPPYYATTDQIFTVTCFTGGAGVNGGCSNRMTVTVEWRDDSIPPFPSVTEPISISLNLPNLLGVHIHFPFPSRDVVVLKPPAESYSVYSPDLGKCIEFGEITTDEGPATVPIPHPFSVRTINVTDLDNTIFVAPQVKQGGESWTIVEGNKNLFDMHYLSVSKFTKPIQVSIAGVDDDVTIHPSLDPTKEIMAFSLKDCDDISILIPQTFLTSLDIEIPRPDDNAVEVTVRNPLDPFYKTELVSVVDPPKTVVINIESSYLSDAEAIVSITTPGQTSHVRPIQGWTRGIFVNPVNTTTVDTNLSYGHVKLADYTLTTQPSFHCSFFNTTLGLSLGIGYSDQTDFATHDEVMISSLASVIIHPKLLPNQVLAGIKLDYNLWQDVEMSMIPSGAPFPDTSAKGAILFKGGIEGPPPYYMKVWIVNGDYVYMKPLPINYSFHIFDLWQLPDDIVPGDYVIVFQHPGVNGDYYDITDSMLKSNITDCIVKGRTLDDDKFLAKPIKITSPCNVDLLVNSTDISFNPELPNETENVQISAIIRNTGSQSAFNVKVRFYDGNPSGWTQIGLDQTIALIPAHGERTASISCQLTGGTHVISVVANPGSIPEDNDMNNMGTSNLGVKPTDEDFIMPVSPSTNQTTIQGQNVTYNINLISVFNFSSPVTLILSGQPSESTYTFTPASFDKIETWANSTLLISTTDQTPTGTHDLTVTASGGSTTRSYNTTLTVHAPGPLVDVYTERGGQGSDQSSDPFFVGEEVTLLAHLTYDGGPLPNSQVTFKVNDTAQNVVYSSTVQTDGTGHASAVFDSSGAHYAEMYTAYATYQTSTDTAGFELMGADIAVTNVEVSKTTVETGEQITINVTIRNEGNESASVSISLCANGNPEQTQAQTLAKKDTKTLDFSWQSSVPGTYTISANSTVAGKIEIDNFDNTYTNGIVTVESPPPVCEVSPTSLNFSTVTVGSYCNKTFTITNIGGGTLTGTVSESCSHYSIVSGGGSYSLGADESVIVTVRFAPTTAGTHTCIVSTGASCSNVSCTGYGCTPGVGGVLIPIDKLGLMAPYIGLASTILVATAATAIYAKRVKRKKEKQ